ncbi:hypothetical protein PBCVAN69C_506L [Paramecium bursaria Chlorella virus AN69C]|uniref:Uncharacterized protein n=1 Tax=Paramecium bursaria Chlorella virus IL3A TaxID=46019 RepID=M1HV15_PBCVI|nr:hypothetical protein PBCVAN69C_506L [Paramecium bursaria Chlorella virus AN69C]AGE54019.1 hypothetical protein PBCVIL3A_662R [Paramecium bursaria Chlorella virus IL3A]
MAFRSVIISHIESLVENIEKHNFKISSTMKAEFVEFLNNYSKYHLDTTEIEYKLTANMLFAHVDDIRVVVATDSSKEFQIPGCNITMREKIEAFILVDEGVAYDSVLMRRFHKPSPSNEQANTPPPPQVIQAIQAIQAPAPPPAPASTNVFNTPAPASTSAFTFGPPTAPTPTPSATNAFLAPVPSTPTTPATPATTNTFLTSTTPSAPTKTGGQSTPMNAFNFNASPSSEPFKSIFPSTTNTTTPSSSPFSAFAAKPTNISSFNLTRDDSTTSSSKW